MRRFRGRTARGADLLSLEIAYLARQRRLRDTQPVGGPAKVQGLQRASKIAPNGAIPWQATERLELGQCI